MVSAVTPSASAASASSSPPEVSDTTLAELNASKAATEKLKTREALKPHLEAALSKATTGSRHEQGLWKMRASKIAKEMWGNDTRDFEWLKQSTAFLRSAVQLAPERSDVVINAARAALQVNGFMARMLSVAEKIGFDTKTEPQTLVTLLTRFAKDPTALLVRLKLIESYKLPGASEARAAFDSLDPAKKAEAEKTLKADEASPKASS